MNRDDGRKRQRRKRPVSCEGLEGRLLLADPVAGLPIGEADLLGTAFSLAVHDPLPANPTGPANFTIQNSGIEASGSFAVRFVLSDDATIALGDTVVGTTTVGSLAARGGSFTGSMALNLPAKDPFRTDNQYYIGMIIDPLDAVDERNEANNSNRGLGLDLASVTAEKELPSPLDGDNVNATFFFANTTAQGAIGDEWAFGDIDLYRMSAVGGQGYSIDLDGAAQLQAQMRLYDSAFIRIATGFGGGAPGEPETDFDPYIQFTAPASGTYYLAVHRVQNLSTDPRNLAGRNENFGAGPYSLTIAQTKPDLTPGVLDPDFAQIGPDGLKTFDYTVLNQGYGNGRPFNVKFYLSDDAVISGGDTLLATRQFFGLVAMGSVGGSITLDLADNGGPLVDNQYYLGMIVDADAELDEISEFNNVSTRLDVDKFEFFAERHLPSPVDGINVNADGASIGFNIQAIGDEYMGNRDQDIYYFTPTKTQLFGFDFDRDGAGGASLDGHLRLYDSSWNLLDQNDTGAPPGEAASNEAYLERVFEAGSTYYVVVSASGNHTSNPRVLTGRTAASTGNYRLGIAAPELDLAGFELIAPDPLAAGGTYGARVTVRNSGDVLSPATNVAFFLREDSITSPYNNEILRVPLPQLAAHGEHVFDVVLHPPDPDPYRSDNRYFISAFVDPDLLIHEESEGAGNVRTVQITSEAHVRVPASTAGLRASPLAVNGSATSIIGEEWIGPYDVDTYVLTAVAGQRLALDMDRPEGSSLDSHIRLYNSAFTLLASNDNGVAPGESPSTDSYVEFTFATAGTYYLVVAASGNHTGDPRLMSNRSAASTGAYTLSATQISPPRVTQAVHDFNAAPNVLRLTFNQDIESVLTQQDLSVLDASGQPVPFTLTYDAPTRTATARFMGILADGNYRATLAAGGIVDSAGNALDGDSNGTGGDDFVLSFFSLRGDANRDRIVNHLDFDLLFANFGKTGARFDEGDFDWDGVVGFKDFQVLETRFGRAVPAPAPVFATQPPIRRPVSLAPRRAVTGMSAPGVNRA